MSSKWSLQTPKTGHRIFSEIHLSEPIQTIFKLAYGAFLSKLWIHPPLQNTPNPAELRTSQETLVLWQSYQIADDPETLWLKDLPSKPMASVDMEWIPFHQPLRHPSQTSAFSQWKEMNFFRMPICQWWGDSEAMACGNAHKIWTTIPPSRNPGSASPQVGYMESFRIQLVILRLLCHLQLSQTQQLPHLLGLGTSPVGIFCWTPLASHAKAILTFLSTKKKTKKSPIQILTSLIENKNHKKKQNHPKITQKSWTPQKSPNKKKTKKNPGVTWLVVPNGMKMPEAQAIFCTLGSPTLQSLASSAQRTVFWGERFGWKLAGKKNQGTDGVSVVLVPNSNETRAILRCKPKSWSFLYNLLSFCLH